MRPFPGRVGPRRDFRGEQGRKPRCRCPEGDSGRRDPAPSAHLRELPRTTSAARGRASLRPDLGGRKAGRWSPVLGTPGPSPVRPISSRRRSRPPGRAYSPAARPCRPSSRRPARRPRRAPRRSSGESWLRNAAGLFWVCCGTSPLDRRTAGDLAEAVRTGFDRTGRDIRDLRSEVHGVRTELHAEIRETRVELRAEIAELRQWTLRLTIGMTIGFLSVLAAILARGA